MMKEQIASRPLELTYEDYEEHKKNLVGMTIDEYKVIRVLGKGQFGTVYLAQNKSDIKFALKVLDLIDIRKEINPRVKDIREKLAHSEPKLMMQCQSPYLLKCFDLYENRDLKVLIMELCEGKNLDTYLRKKKILPQREAVQIMRQLINGIAELHRHDIVHRDLKTQNIMEHQGQYKIIDFGFSKKLNIKDELEEVKNTVLGTPTTMAPQVYSRKNYGLKADIWSLGIIFFELVFGVQPYDSSNAKRFYNQIENKFKENKLQINKVTLSEEAFDFLSKVLIVDTDKRMSWRQMLEHPLIKVKAEEPLPQRFVQRPSMIFADVQVDPKLVEETMKPSELYSVGETSTQHEVAEKTEERPKFNLNKQIQEQRRARQEQEQKQLKKTQLEMERRMKEAERARKSRDEQLMERLKVIKERNKKIEMQQMPFRLCLEMHLSCLKTELAFNEIFLPIERHNLLNKRERQNIQFLHLLLSRCFKNMSPLKEELRKNAGKVHKAFENLNDQVNYLYDQVKIYYDEYDQTLRDKENKMTEIGKDFFSKIFYKKHSETKNKLIGGIQSMPGRDWGDYNIGEQINFTCEYIERVSEKMVSMGNTSARVRKYLQHYRAIMGVSEEELGDQTFSEYVKRTTN